MTMDVILCQVFTHLSSRFHIAKPTTMLCSDAQDIIYRRPRVLTSKDFESQGYKISSKTVVPLRQFRVTVTVTLTSPQTVSSFSFSRLRFHAAKAM